MTRIVFDRAVVIGRVLIDQFGSKQDEIAEVWMDEIAVSPHMTKSGLHGHRLVRNNPDAMARGLLHFHWKAHGRIDGSDAKYLKLCGDANLVDLAAGPMKLDIGDRARGAAIEGKLARRSAIQHRSLRPPSSLTWRTQITQLAYSWVVFRSHDSRSQNIRQASFRSAWKFRCFDDHIGEHQAQISRLYFFVYLDITAGQRRSPSVKNV